MSQQIYGLIGYPVSHSLSPQMHNAAFAFLKIPAEYRLFEIKPEKLQDFLLGTEIQDTKGESFFSGNIQGFNITIPYKVPLLKNTTVRSDPSIILAGAVNTAVRRGGGKIGYYNTDSEGFLKSLEEFPKFNTRNRRVLIFGCGGAGRAVVAGLMLEGGHIKKIYLYDTSKEALESANKHFSRLDYLVKGRLEFISEKDIPEKMKEADLLINASPVGMKEGDGSIIDKGLLKDNKNHLSVYDVVYNRKTQLVIDAEEQGIPVKGGLGMLLYQGVRAFEIWTGQPAPVEVMRRALEEGIKK